jgi:hypothetical protein
MTVYMMNHGKFNTPLVFNGQANLQGVAGDVFVLYNQTSISLRWGQVVGANFYQIQISLFPDFRSNFVDTSVSESSYAFTDSQTNDAKRYWRWRPSVTVGANYMTPWSDVGSYWLNTGAALQIEIPEGYWTIFDKDNVTDQYIFDLAPVYTIVPRNVYRFQGRNRQGTLLTEFLTVKDEIELQFEGGQYIAHAQMDELQRFNNTKRTFFLATYTLWSQSEPIPHIWKVECSDDPTFTMIAAGRPDLLRGKVALIEV